MSIDIATMRTTLVRTVKDLFREPHTSGTPPVTTYTYPVEAVFVKQNGVRPRTAFVSIGFPSFGKVTNDEVMLPNAEGVSGVVGNRDLVIVLEAFGDANHDAITMLETIRSATETPLIHAKLSQGGIVVYDQSDLLDLAWLEEDVFTSRAQISFYARTASASLILDTSVGVIETVSMSGDVSGNTRSFIINPTEGD